MLPHIRTHSECKTCSHTYVKHGPGARKIDFGGACHVEGCACRAFVYKKETANAS